MDTRINKDFYQGAMYSGTMLGAVWNIMYLLLFTGTTHLFSILISLSLYFASPFIAAQSAIRYRRKECDNTMSYIQAWIFVLYMYICATLLSTFITYIYFVFFDDGTFIMTLQKMLEESMKIAGTDELLIQQIEQTKNIIEKTTTNNRLNNGEKNMKRIQSQDNNICPALTTRCDCLGVVVKDE